jgi:hypothetical protein
MYCPSCGTELTSELTYCNRCGANLKNQFGVPTNRMTGAAWAISIAVMLVTLGGFGMIFSLVMTLISTNTAVPEGGMLVIFLSLLIILLIDWLLVRQLSRVLDISQLAGAATQPKKPKLPERPIQQIDAPGEPAASVTEHTTRTFEPIHRGRDTQR